ncbi:unnamed protein product, partial [Mesorhabditis belari]|uniref:Serine racemase n=1 Tax=Mesorhabditis belari TaxID=2138241 RepID=A0AAF3EJ34_9BILA
MSDFTAKEVVEAAERIKNVVHKTPIFTSETIDRFAGCHVFFKGEHLQKTGSFKARGACNAVQLLKEAGKTNGVITHSSGNHGQGLSYAARAAGLPCTVVVPRTAPPSKLEGMKAYGAEIILCEPTMKSREETCEKVATERGLTIVPPFDDQVIMAGQGTAAVELLDELPNLDAVFLAVGGGGLAAGMATYIKQTKPNVQVYLVEPNGKGLHIYLENGQIRGDLDSLNTIADGIRVLRVGANPYPILQKYCKDTILTVGEEEIKEAVALIWTRLKQRVEPTAGVPLAGLLKMAKEVGFALKGKNVAIILCGGNCDLTFLPL